MSADTPQTRDEKLLGWLAEKACDYLRWYGEREVKDAPLCPDCEQPEPWCYCDEKARQDRIAQDAFDAGFDRGMEANR